MCDLAVGDAEFGGASILDPNSWSQCLPKVDSESLPPARRAVWLKGLRAMNISSV